MSEKTYKVKEMFFTLQGEGPYSGCPALFVRMSGCNMWSGREEDRPKGKGSCARWCDTDFVGTNGTHGGSYTAEELRDKIATLLVENMPAGANTLAPVIFTGGEPLLQLDKHVLEVLKRVYPKQGKYARGMTLHVETNGTVRPEGVHHLGKYFGCVVMSPKIGRKIVLKPCEVTGVKVVLTQEHVDYGFFELFTSWREQSPGLKLYLQPLDAGGEPNYEPALKKLFELEGWRLCLQTHKIVGLR